MASHFGQAAVFSFFGYAHEVVVMEGNGLEAAPSAMSSWYAYAKRQLIATTGPSYSRVGYEERVNTQFDPGY